MKGFQFAAVLGLVAHAASAALTVLPQAFALPGASPVNVKLTWTRASQATSYRVLRNNQVIATAPGDSYEDYGLTAGTSYTYTVQALNNNTIADQSGATPFTLPSFSGTTYTFDNTKPSTTYIRGQIKYNNVYYSYSANSDSNGFANVTEATSSDGFNFTGARLVLDAATVCAPISQSCKLEAVGFHQHPGTGKVVLWAHYEKQSDYSLGYAMSAGGTPGQGTWTFYGAGRPLGHDSRDLTFANNGTTAWIVSSTNTNTDMNIYNLKSDWSNVTSLAATVNKGQYREAPALIIDSGYFYLFTSRAAGWYPSESQYISAPSITGPWSAPRDSGSTATFATQSGGVSNVGANYWAMSPNRWSAQWTPTAGPNRALMLPISLANGFATFNYYPQVVYSGQGTGILYGIAPGRLRSVGKPVAASGQNVSALNDGTQDDVSSYFVPSAVPFSITLDLGQAYTITSVDLTTNLEQGSETYYQYMVQGSTDNSSFGQIGDQSGNTVVGFVPTPVTSGVQYRYVRVVVNKIINTHNNNEADFAKGVVELSVYTKEL